MHASLSASSDSVSRYNTDPERRLRKIGLAQDAKHQQREHNHSLPVCKQTANDCFTDILGNRSSNCQELGIVLAGVTRGGVY